MSDQLLARLQLILSQCGAHAAIPVELLYIYSVALCELQYQLQDDNAKERIVKEYGTRLLAQLNNAE